MNIDLYTTASKKDAVKKALKNETIITGCRLLDATNILNPTIIFKASEIASYISYNYARIPQFNNRFYYISNIEFESNLCKISMSVDAVASWYDDYKNTTQLVTRSESLRNRYIVDGSEPIHSDNWYTYADFGDDVFDKKCDRVILTTAGRGTLTTHAEREVYNG